MSGQSNNPMLTVYVDSEGKHYLSPEDAETAINAAFRLLGNKDSELADLRRQLAEMTAKWDGMVDLYTTACQERLEMQGRAEVAEQVREEVLAENEGLSKQLAETEALRHQAAAMRRALEYGIKELSAYFESCGRPGRTPKLHRILERQRKAVDAIDAGKALKAAKEKGRAALQSESAKQNTCNECGGSGERARVYQPMADVEPLQI